METGWRNSFTGADGVAEDNQGQNDHLTNNAWDITWDNISTTHPACTRYDWTNPVAATARIPESASVVHALLFGVTNTTTFSDVWNNNSSSNNSNNSMRDPHMMCLKLGKRHYCDDAVIPESSSSATGKRGRPPYLYDTATAKRWPGVRVASSTRCQVEGCNVVLGNTKEYYKRHKVCEIHSKAPKVVVSGSQQRFCQQCSRFHDVREFDEAKRSCRRRLEGHNLRRRKGVISNSLPRNFPHSHENNSTMEQRLGPLSPSPSPSQSKPVCALSLLSSSKAEPWISSGDLSSRCSAALYELIAANRATHVSGHFLNQNSSHQQIVDNTMCISHDPDRFSHTSMAFDVKQAPALDFGLLAMKEKSKDPEEWNDYCWSAFGGANVV